MFSLFLLTSPTFMPRQPVLSGFHSKSHIVMHEASRRGVIGLAVGLVSAASVSVEGASAKAGEFGKIEIFGFSGSSPYQPGGPRAGKDATFGYTKSAGPMLADG